jgi:hypothetical protein
MARTIGAFWINSRWKLMKVHNWSSLTVTLGGLHQDLWQIPGFPDRIFFAFSGRSGGLGFRPDRDLDPDRHSCIAQRKNSKLRSKENLKSI